MLEKFFYYIYNKIKNIVKKMQKIWCLQKKNLYLQHELFNNHLNSLVK
jgi:hypothetical protein